MKTMYKLVSESITDSTTASSVKESWILILCTPAGLAGQEREVFRQYMLTVEIYNEIC